MGARIRARGEPSSSAPSITQAVPAPREVPNVRVAGGIDLERAIAELPDRAREVFVLHDVEGYRHEEIAKMLDIVPGTSKSQLHRARKQLREALKS